MTRHIASSLETSPATSHSASPLDTDGEDEFIDTVEVSYWYYKQHTVLDILLFPTYN